MELLGSSIAFPKWKPFSFQW